MGGQRPGTLLDYKVEGWGTSAVEEKHFDYKWKTSALFRVRRHDAGWVLEIKIPFAKDLLRTPRRGDSWRATFNRIDIDRQGHSSLSTFSALNRRDRFGSTSLPRSARLSSDSPLHLTRPVWFG